MSKTKKYMICDSCGKAKGDHEYVGYDMVFCQECISKHLVKMPDGFRFKISSEQKGNCNV